MSKEKRCNLLITTCNGQEKVSMYKLMRSVPEWKFVDKIVVCDAGDGIQGKHWAQEDGNAKFVKVPFCEGNHENYTEFMRNLIKEEEIDVVMPIDVDEGVCLKPLEKELGIKVIFGSNIERHMVDKDWQIDFIKAHAGHGTLLMDAVSDPVTFSGTPEEVLEYLQNNFWNKDSKFYKQEFIIKPVGGRGSRGFRRVVPWEKFRDIYNSEKFFATISCNMCEWLLKALHPEDKILVQSYWSGKSYSIDCYTDKDGKVHPRASLRTGHRWGQVQQADNVYDADILEFCQQASELFNFDSFWNVELNRDENGALKLVEFNLRLTADMHNGIQCPDSDPLLHAFADMGYCEHPKDEHINYHFGEYWMWYAERFENE